MDRYTLLMLGNLLIISFWISNDPRSFKERVKYFFQIKTLLYWTSLISGFYLEFLHNYFYRHLSLGLPTILVNSGLGLYLFGFVFALWARFTMKDYWGNPAQHHIQRQNKLVTSGPFRICRNPIYVGLFFIVFGGLLSLDSPLIIITIPLALMIHKGVTIEEKLLTKHFGKDYLNYTQKVRRYL